VNVLVLSSDDSRILLIQRVKPPLVGWWLPPGGHVEPEETRNHIQLEPIADRHNHLDLIYIARPVNEAPQAFDDSRVRWFAVQEALGSDLVPENTKVPLTHRLNRAAEAQT